MDRNTDRNAQESAAHGVDENWSSKPAGRSSPPVGWFDSIAAPWGKWLHTGLIPEPKRLSIAGRHERASPKAAPWADLADRKPIARRCQAPGDRDPAGAR
jgi:hypothetical protein